MDGIVKRNGDTVEGKWSTGREFGEDSKNNRVIGDPGEVVLGFALRYHEDEEDDDDIGIKDGDDAGKIKGAEPVGRSTGFKIEARLDDSAPHRPDRITDEQSPGRGGTAGKRIGGGSGIRGVFSSDGCKMKMKKRATKKRRRRKRA